MTLPETLPSGCHAFQAGRPVTEHERLARLHTGQSPEVRCADHPYDA